MPGLLCLDSPMSLHSQPNSDSSWCSWSSCSSSSEDANALSEMRDWTGTRKHKNSMSETPNTYTIKEQTRITIFLNTFLSLMYLQALICFVSLKYYKHFSDLGHLNFFFLSCIFARYHLNMSGLFVYGPTCIASWVYTTASCEAYVHY